jgi:glucokinase
MSSSVDRYLLGFDLGGTRLKSATVAPDGRVLRSAMQETGSNVNASVLVSMLLDTARSLMSDSDAIRCGGVGVALPGFVDPTFGARGLPGKLPGMEGYPLRERVERELGLPVRCIADGAAATMAEWLAGAGAGVDDVVVITLGTGVGSGVIINGQPLANRHLGTGGGIGQFTIQTGGRLCLCGNRGCAETLISTPAVVGKLNEHLARGVRSSLQAIYTRNPAAITFRSLIDGVARGDRLCADVLNGFVRDLGATIVSAIHAYNPSVVVLCGGMTEAADTFLPAVQRYVDEYRWVHPGSRQIPILKGTLEPFAGAIGAALQANRTTDHAAHHEMTD